MDKLESQESENSLLSKSYHLVIVHLLSSCWRMELGADTDLETW